MLELKIVYKKAPISADDLWRAVQSQSDYFSIFRLGELLSMSPVLAYSEGLRILDECRQADSTALEKAHKGTIYYWMGMAAFLMQDYQTAAFFMDSAASEDLRFVELTTNTPALHFLKFEGSRLEQAAQPLVKCVEAALNELTSYYNCGLCGSASPPLTLDDIRMYLVDRALCDSTGHLRTLCTTLISYVAEYSTRKRQLELVASPTTNEPFYVHLVKGCLLFESLLKCNPLKKLSREKLQLGDVLDELAVELCLPRHLKISDVVFQDVVCGLPPVMSTVKEVVETCGKTRNTLAHQLEWGVKLSAQQYEQLYKAIGAACMHVIAKLYLPLA